MCKGGGVAGGSCVRREVRARVTCVWRYPRPTFPPAHACASTPPSPHLHFVWCSEAVPAGAPALLGACGLLHLWRRVRPVLRECMAAMVELVCSVHWLHLVPPEARACASLAGLVTPCLTHPCTRVCRLVDAACSWAPLAVRCYCTLSQRGTGHGCSCSGPETSTTPSWPSLWWTWTMCVRCSPQSREGGGGGGAGVGGRRVIGTVGCGVH